MTLSFQVKETLSFQAKDDIAQAQDDIEFKLGIKSSALTTQCHPELVEG